MSFICQNPDCSAPENKKNKSYPSAMDCPFCDVPLVEVVSFSDEEITLINSLPYVIAYPLQKTLKEKHAWTKINLLKDTFLNYLKYLGLITASEFFNSSFKDKKMVALFQQALAEPSFGSWNQYIRETLNYLNENNHPFFCPDLVSYYELVETGKKRKLFKGEIEFIDSNGDVQLKKQEATAIGMLINFRNRFLGHGLTLNETSSQKLWEEYYPYFKLLLEQLSFAKNYPMFKQEHGETFKLQSAELISIEKESHESARVWIESPAGDVMDILPFYVVPGEVSINKEDKEQILAYESYTGKTIKFFSPEGTEKQTSGKILERLNLLLRDKLKEEAYSPEQFTKEIFTSRIESENKLLLDILIAEKKVIPGVYVHREEIEIKLREWIGARANIFFIAAEAGSGKTNLLVEIQKQYQERDYSSMIIRAGRMEKTSLKKQIAYILNIDENTDICEYKAIAGTQDKPVFILIDGLNEATNAEAIWQEIIELSKQFVPGSLKFVISSRANTKADIDRYSISTEEENFIYGENKENEKGLSAYCHWLTALNMVEMKNAWESYMSKDKSKFKPQFTFDDLATFDRALYNQINNPLILRLFLEIYNGKPLPKKGNKHLNIWGDWLNTFTEAEQTFFKLIANEIWIKGENELLLDDLLNNPNLKPYFTTDVINAPYPRLKNNGWISRFVKDLNSYVAFTVEGALLYLLGVKLQQQNPTLDLNSVHEILSDGNKLKRSAIESFLCRESLDGKLELVCEIIDAYEEHHDICVTPLLYFLKAFGPKAMLDIVLTNPTDNDWILLLEINSLLENLQLHFLKNEFLLQVSKLQINNSKNEILINLIAVEHLDYEDAILIYNKIKSNVININDSEILFEFAMCEKKFGDYQSCLDLLYKSIKSNKFKHLLSEQIYNHYYEIIHTYLLIGNIEKAKENIHILFDTKLYKWSIIDIARSYNLKGYIGTSMTEFYKDESLLDDVNFNYNKSLELRKIILGEFHPDTALSINNLAYVFLTTQQYEKALKYFNECLNIYTNTLDPYHINLAMVYNNLGVTYTRIKNYSSAIEYLLKVLNIYKVKLGEDHYSLNLAFNNLAKAYFNNNQYAESLINFEKCLAIEQNARDIDHPIITTMYYNIGNCYKEMRLFEKAIEIYNKGLDFLESKQVALTYMNSNAFMEYIDFHGSYYFSMGEALENIGNIELSLNYYLKSAEFRNIDPKYGLKHNDTIHAVKNSIRLAIQLGKEDELPDWMK